MDAQHVWLAALARIQQRVSAGAYTTWFRDTLGLELSGATLTVGVGSSFACEHLRQRFADVARVALSETLARPAHVVFQVSTPPRTPQRAEPCRSLSQPHSIRSHRNTQAGSYEASPAYAPHSAPGAGSHPGLWYAQPPLLRADACASAVPPQRSAKAQKQTQPPARSSQEAPAMPRRALATPRLLTAGEPGEIQHALHPQYRFETFVVGVNNRLAYAAAQEVTRAPGQSYNPLVLCGDAGLGKTHLLHAIGHRARMAGLQVIYVTAEQFTNELVEAIRSHTSDTFRQRYRAVDVLLMDDVQLIAGRESTEEEFFHTFNWLHEANKQIVLGSDCAPQSMRRLHDRLRSRFAWGLIADIQPPDADCRFEMARAKAQAQQIDMDGEALAALARPACASVRELEGRLTRVAACARLYECPIDAALVMQALAPLSASSGMAPGNGAEQMGSSAYTAQHGGNTTGHSQPTVSVKEALAAVAQRFGVTVEALVGKSREHQVAWARQVAMYLLREVTNASLFQIGAQLGGRDHTTIMHGCARVSQALMSDQRLRDDLSAIRRELAHL